MTFDDFLDMETSPTIAKLASSLGVSPVTIYRYRQGTRIPEPRIMALIVKHTKGAVVPNDFYPDSQRAIRRLGLS